MEKEKLFYDLHQTIKDVGRNGKSRSIRIDSYVDWIKRLTGEISQMKDETLDIVLDIYAKLTSYTIDNLHFIILNANSLKGVFYPNGKFVEKNLALLYKPYDECLVYSPIITLYCLQKGIKGNEVWNCVLRCHLGGDQGTIEDLILGKKIQNRKIIEALNVLLELHKISPKFVENIADDAGPLHKMQMDIYTKTRKDDAKKQRDEYLHFLLTHKYDDDIIARVIDYISNHEFIEYETVKAIELLDIKNSNEVIAKYGKDIFNLPNFKKLYKESEKITEKLHQLYSTKQLKFEEVNNLLEHFLEFDELEIELIEKLL